MRVLTSPIILVLTCAACTDSSSGGTDVSGAGAYHDAVTNADGSPHTAATPPAQSAQVSLRVDGTATLTGVDITCADGLGGAFQALYRGDAQLGDGGTFSGTLDAAGALTTPHGCAIPSMTGAVVTGVTLRAALDATTTNCSSYCAASARATAESQCAASADQATCRADAEAAASASCTTSCTTQAHAIVAEASLGAAALGSVDADQLRAGAFGALHAQLTFDHLEDANGNRIHE